MVDPDSPSNQGNTDGGDTPQRMSTIFRLLANKNRRIALHVLQERRGELVEIRDLANEIVATRAPDETVDPAEIELTLRHAHCPKLADAGIVEYDDERGAVRYVGDPLLESGLELANNADFE